MNSFTCAQYAVSRRAPAIGLAALAVVLAVCTIATPAHAGSRWGRDRSRDSSDTVVIEPRPLFDESELRALFDKPTIVSFTADKTTITKGQEVTLSWRIENATSVWLSYLGKLSSNTAGSVKVKPTKKTTYTLYGRNGVGETTKNLTINVSNIAVITDVHIVKPLEVKPMVGVLMVENVAYDLVAKANTALWVGSAKLTYGQYGGPHGFARTLKSAKAEDNKSYNNCIHMGPSQRVNGMVYGRYQVPIPPNGRFVCTVGFGHGVGTADGAGAFVLVRGPGEPHYRTVAHKHIRRDGKLDTITADLKQYANKTITLQLQVNAGKQFHQDMVLWIAPRILK